MSGMMITERDLEILAFLLDMKFATVKDLQHKFFRKLKNGSVSMSEWYARERMRMLWKHGYVESVRFRYTDYKYFIATDLAFEILEGKFSRAGTLARPIKQIDIRTFEHDSMLMKLRLHLEDQEGIKGWRSERVLKRVISGEGRIVRDYAPDGLYEDSERNLVAFELELTMKSRNKYKEKLLKYQTIMHKFGKQFAISFDRARFVCATPEILETLKREARIYDNSNDPKMKFELVKNVFNEPNREFKLRQYGLLVNQYGNLRGWELKGSYPDYFKIAEFAMALF